MTFSIRGSLLASSFICLNCFFVQPVFAKDGLIKNQALIKKALDVNLHEHPIWLSLLHYRENKPRIQDNHFLVSTNNKQENFSPKKELEATIYKLFKQHDKKKIKCRFPARDYWLRKQLQLPENDYSDCKELHEFLEKAPMDKLSVVYSSENLTSASSMMGHVLFKLSGETPKGEQKEHAITFYTEVKGINLPKILYDSVVQGKEGYFALSPYQEKHNHYLQTEQRNVWIYDLNLTQTQLKLIQYHLWELRQTKLKYFFHTYNCATFTNIILSLSNNTVINAQDGWKSPLDTVKAIHNAKLVDATHFFPSPRVKVRMLMENKNSKWQQKTYDAFRKDNPSLLPKENSQENLFFQVKTLEALSGYFSSRNKTIKTPKIQNFIKKQQKKLSPNLVININNYKSPTLAPFDSQIYLKIQQSNDDKKLILGFLPASHTLDDDQRQSLNHSQLRIADMAIAISEKNKTIQLSQFDLYAMTTFVTRDNVTGGISSSFKMGYKQHKKSNLSEYGATYIEGGVGLSHQLHTDITLATLGYLKFDYGKNLNAVIYPEISLLINGIYDSKIVLQNRHSFSLLNQKSDVANNWNETSVKVARSFTKNNRISLGANFFKGAKNSDTEISLTWKWLY